MDQVERLARTVAQQRTGDEHRWQEFKDIVEQAVQSASENPDTTPRDYLDSPENPHPSGFTPMLTHVGENGVKTQVIDQLDAAALADTKGLANVIEWQLRQKNDDPLGDHHQGGTVTWSIGESPTTGEKWLKVQFDPR